MQTDPGGEVVGAAVEVIEVVDDRLVDKVVMVVDVDDLDEVVEVDVDVGLVVVVVEMTDPLPTQS